VIATLLAAALLAPSPTESHPVVVGETRLSRGHLRHWADIAQRAGGYDRAAARGQAAMLLIANRWVMGEAAERGIVVTRAQVDRVFRELRDENFPRRRDYRAFLRRIGQRPADIRFRVRVQLHSDALRESVTAGATTPEAQQERLDAFIPGFHAKWRARTACRAPWISELDCGTTSPGRTRRSPARGRQASRWDGGLGWSRIPSTTPFRPIAPGS
jgi:hypothetical protein